MKSLKDKLQNLPIKPGVYLMKDKAGRIIYVGKAKILKNRVRQYFQSFKKHSVRIQSMITNINDFEYIITDTEMEALILECNLIKKHRPYYNVSLKDDKNYPYIKVTMSEDYPRIFLSRKLKRDGSRYFGPYTNSESVRTTIDTIKKIFKVRSCRKKLPEMIGKERPCLNYHINQCIAPCKGDVTSQQYKSIFENIFQFLEGKQINIIKSLENEMVSAAEKMNFEKAAELRDTIDKIKIVSEKQNIISLSLGDIDIIVVLLNYHVDSCIQMLSVRNGKMIGAKNFRIESKDEKDIDEIISSYIKEYYNDNQYIPKEILIQKEISDQKLIEEWLTHNKGKKVILKVPMRGEKKKLIDMAFENAKEYIEEEALKLEKELNTLEQLKDMLEIDRNINRIECYDISNTSGQDSVGVMVVYNNHKFDKQEYRKFKIKSVDGANDYESIKEVLYRRFKRALSNDGKFSDLPTLVFVDGGKGHVNSAKEVLNHLHINIPVFGLAKDDKHRTHAIVKNNEKIIIPKNNQVYNFVTRIQDETHRFAISYHRSLRSKKNLMSTLEQIEGIGKKRREYLLRHFKTIKSIKEADIEELKNVKSMNISTATAVYNFFHKK